MLPLAPPPSLPQLTLPQLAAPVPLASPTSPSMLPRACLYAPPPAGQSMSMFASPSVALLGPTPPLLTPPKTPGPCPLMPWLSMLLTASLMRLIHHAMAFATESAGSTMPHSPPGSLPFHLPTLLLLMLGCSDPVAPSLLLSLVTGAALHRCSLCPTSHHHESGI